jgi:DNA-directed RNA polymerase subunit RPC12/RpoP
MENTGDLAEWRKSVAIYHSLPTIIAVLVVVLFMVTWYETDNYLLSASVAAAPSLILLWRWSTAAKLIGCPHCSGNLKSRWYWSYPPRNCPNCGATLRLVLGNRDITTYFEVRCRERRVGKNEGGATVQR